MDILDEFQSEEHYLTRDKQLELKDLINAKYNKEISKKEYYKRLIKFWNENGFPEMSEDDILETY
tara:strand:+ start:127 stop:321 length:195 start_codon:yes stop_codon:yes gene_type:complete